MKYSLKDLKSEHNDEKIMECLSTAIFSNIIQKTFGVYFQIEPVTDEKILQCLSFMKRYDFSFNMW